MPELLYNGRTFPSFNSTTCPNHVNSQAIYDTSEYNELGSGISNPLALFVQLIEPKS